MKIYKKITDAIVKVTGIILMLLVAGLAGLIIFELLIRNLLDKSFRASIEVCGIMFMWMAFLGIIYLYDKSRLMRFEILLVRVKEPVTTILWYINKIVSLMLGAVMVLSYINLYPFISTRYFSTIQFLPYSFQFLPMALAGGFMVLKTIYQLIEKSTVPAKREGKGR
ncbi:TRAP transporter small permease [Marasmitruncus massiliensis]|uniref:TRAP transporter small permease n=1 Tax=Marasmitruncus massiliensis TaxID=1944642 RepID=UPI000C7BFC84|nr:TRAP transporter small permease [Marasmitruncus massiliensis]